MGRFLGDGVLAYFGWPRAHEHNAERAVRAGLRLVNEMARLEPRAEVRLQARVGIATGQVVVGDLISEGVSDKDAVSGDTPNLAARLQGIAEPGSVVISPLTRRLVGGLFELTDLGPQRLKGFPEPLRPWRVEGYGRAEGRFEARQSQIAGLTPLVGREKELARLLRRWRQAADGKGQVVLLSGEPGIGKSRLVWELRERLSDGPHYLLYQCSPLHTDSALHPVTEHFARVAGFARDDTVADSWISWRGFSSKVPTEIPKRPSCLRQLWQSLRTDAIHRWTSPPSNRNSGRWRSFLNSSGA